MPWVNTKMVKELVPALFRYDCIFHPVKIIAGGEGGMITTNSKKYYQNCCYVLMVLPKIIQIFKIQKRPR